MVPAGIDIYCSPRSRALSEFTTNLRDLVRSETDTSYLLFFFAGALTLLASPVSSMLIGPIHHGLVEEILEAGGGEEEARVPPI